MTEHSSYRSHADLGGTTGHGPVERDSDGPDFHRAWEAKALALTIAAGASGAWNLDMSRRYRETLPDYADLTYYEIWTAALERLLVDRGLVSEDELASGRAIVPPAEVLGVLTADRVAAAMARGGPTEREPTVAARFGIGDRVLTRSGRVDHHTRLPGYVTGKVGTIERLHGAHVFPDTHAHDEGEQPTWLYTVAFDAGDLWDDAGPRQCVSVDAWEPYLEPAS